VAVAVASARYKYFLLYLWCVEVVCAIAVYDESLSKRLNIIVCGLKLFFDFNEYSLLALTLASKAKK